MEFHYAFEVTRRIVFEVSYYTLGSNSEPYFTIGAGEFNQPKSDFRAWNLLVLPKGSLARKFSLKWNGQHLKKLNDEQMDDLMADIAELKNAYHYIYDEQETFAGTSSGISFYRERALSMLELKKEGK